MNTRKRITLTLRIDEAIVGALKELAKKSNTSSNRFIETLVMNVAIENGVINKDFEALGETRGKKNND